MTDTELAPGLQATFPYGRLTVAAGQTISSAWGNTTYDQTMEVFASASDRTNQWSSPNEGAQSWLMDSHTPWVYRAGAWHGIPMGWLASATGPATQTDYAVPQTNVVTVTVTVTVGRWYRVTGYANGSQVSTPGNVRVGLSIAAATQWILAVNLLAVSALGTGTGVMFYQATTTGPQVFALTASSSAGAFRLTTNQAVITAEDIGS